MTPKELYDLPLDKVVVSKSIAELLLSGHSHGHLDALDVSDDFDFSTFVYRDNEMVNLPDDPHVEVRIIEHCREDYKRYWRTATVWMNSSPVMVVQNAGRYGDDWKRKWVTDKELYFKLCLYLRSCVLLLCIPKINPHLAGVDDWIADPHEPVAQLDEYYGHRLGQPHLRF
jgi:hypothetical protein